MTAAPIEKRRDFTIVQNEVFDTDLSHGAKLVYMVLQRCADANQRCFPSHRHIARKASCSTDSVGKATVELRAAGWITWEEQFGERGQRLPNLYTVFLSPFEVPCPIPLRAVPPIENDPTPTADSGTPYRSERVPLPPTAVPPTADSGSKEEDPRNQTQLTRPREADAAAREPVAADVGQGERPQFPTQVEQIFFSWQDVVLLDDKMQDAVKAGHQRKRCNQHVKAAIQAALAEYRFVDVLAAAQGWIHDDFEARHTSYADLQYVLKLTNIDKFARWHNVPSSRPKAKRNGFAKIQNSHEHYKHIRPEDKTF